MTVENAMMRAELLLEIAQQSEIQPRPGARPVD